MYAIRSYYAILRIDGSELVRVTTDFSTGLFLLENQTFDNLEALKAGILDYITHSYNFV